MTELKPWLEFINPVVELVTGDNIKSTLKVPFIRIRIRVTDEIHMTPERAAILSDAILAALGAIKSPGGESEND